MAALQAVPRLGDGEVVVESGGASAGQRAARLGARRREDGRAHGARCRRGRPRLALRPAGALAVPPDPARRQARRGRPRAAGLLRRAGSRRQAPPDVGGARARPGGLACGGRHCSGWSRSVTLLPVPDGHRSPHEIAKADRSGSRSSLLAAACGRSKAPAPKLELPDLKRPAGGVAARGARPAAAGLRPHRHEPEEGRARGRRVPAPLLRVRRHRDRDRLPGPRALQRARAPSGPAPRGRAPAAQPHRRRRGLPAVLEGGHALRGQDQARLSLRPRRVRHEVARPRAGPRDAQPQAARHRAGDGHPLSRRGRRRGRPALGRPLAARAPAGVVRRREAGPERGRHDRDHRSRRPVLGARDAPGRVRAGGIRGAFECAARAAGRALGQARLDSRHAAPARRRGIRACWPTT